MPGQILFNNIPGTGLVAPIFSFEANSGGQYSPTSRVILLGKKTAAGSMALNTPVAVASQNQADAFAGPGSQLREMFRVALQNDPAGASYWLLAVDDTGLTANVSTITIAGTPAAGVGTFEICGEKIQIAVTATDTITTIAFAISAAINAYYNPLTGAMLPVTGSSSPGVVTLTSRNKGLEFAEIDVFVDKTIPGNVFAGTNVWTYAVTTPAAGATTGVATALAALGDDPADFVVAPWADSTSLLAYTAWASDVSGRWAWSRQSYGHIWTASVGTFSALTTLGLAQNDRHTSIIGCITGGTLGTPTPSWLWATGFMARTRAWLSDITTGNVSRSHKGLVVQGVRPPRDRSVWNAYNAQNTLVSSGISAWSGGADGSVQISKIVSTYQKGSAGQPDAVFRDVQALYQAAGGLAYLRAQLGQQFGQKALADSNPGNLGAIATPSDVKGALIQFYTQLCRQGVFQDAPTFAALVVTSVNATNPNRLDAYVPMERVNPLDILAANATFYQDYPNAAPAVAA